MKLSESYRVKDDPPKLELIVTQYNINEGHNERLLATSRTLGGYAAFVGKVREAIGRGVSINQAVKQAVDGCIKEHILEDIFRENYEEVLQMGEAEFWEELHYRTVQKESYDEGHGDGYQSGHDAGYQSGHDVGVRTTREEDIRSLIEACRELGANRTKTMEQLTKHFHIDRESAEQYMAQCWDAGGNPAQE